MRIALLSNGFVDYTIQMANGLAKRGETVYLLMPEPFRHARDHRSLDQRGEIHPDVQVQEYPQPRLDSPSNLSVMYHLYKTLRDFAPDVVHSQEVYYWFSFFLPLLKVRGYRVIIEFHDPVPHLGEDYLRARWAKWCGRTFSDVVLVHGIRLREVMAERYPSTVPKLHTIPLGEHQVAPFLKFWREDLQDEGSTILFFGRIVPYKGLEYLIRAEPLITDQVPGARIIIAGQGEDLGKYAAMMVHPDRFDIYNYAIPYAEGATLFQRSSVVILPYVDASQSGVIHTAYGFRKPIVATNVGSLPELVEDGVTGLIVPPRNHEALAASIVRLLEDPALRRHLGENGYRKLKTDLSWDRITDRLIPLYTGARS